MNAIINNDKDDLIAECVKQAFEAKNILDARKFYLQNKEKLGDFVEAGSLLFNYVCDNELIDEDGILKLTDQLYYLNMVVDKEPVFFGMLVTIKKYGRK